MVIRRRIISPDEATTPEEDPDKLEDLGAQPKKRPAPKPDRGEGGSMGPPPGKKPKKAKQVKTPKPKKDPKLRRPKKGKKDKKAAESSEPSKTPQMRDPGQTPQLGEPGKTPPRGYPDGAPLMGEQNPTPGSTPGPTPNPRPGDTDPLEGNTPPLRPEGELTPLGTDPGQIDVRAIPLPPRPAPPLPPPRRPTPPPEPQPQPKPPMLPGRARPLPTPGYRTTPGGETDPSPQREPGEGDNQKEDPGHSSPGRQGGRNGDDSPSSSGDGGNNGDRGNSSDGRNSGDEGNNGDGNSSEGSGSGHDRQNGDGDDNDEEEESEHSGLGACSTPSSQKGDASTEDQTSQAEEPPAKNIRKTGTPAVPPPAKGANKRKAKKPHCKYPRFLQAQAQYTGPGAIYRPLPEESDAVPERGQKEASTVPSPNPQAGCREGRLTKRGLLAQVVATGTRGKKRGTFGEDRTVLAGSYGPV